MIRDNVTERAEWSVAELELAPAWRFTLTAAERDHLGEMIQKAHAPDRHLFEYNADDFDLGPAAMKIATAMNEALFGRGLSMVHGLPREGLSEDQFTVLTWAIGLRTGVPRPQGKATQYISAVRNVGTDYRAASGRGFSSNARLDFHADGADLVALACYNKAKAGGESMVSSSARARRQLLAERPDLAEVAHQPFCFSRQQEETDDEGAFYAQPLFDICEGRVFGKWNRNRVTSAHMNVAGTPPLTDAQLETMDLMDDILSRPKFMYRMWLEPGDLQIVNNHVLLHSRTDFEDFDEPEKKRLLCRLWLAPPNSVPLPESWGDFYRSIAPGTVRGGIRGHHHDDNAKAFEARIAAWHGMPAPNYEWGRTRFAPEAAQ
jgi:hypothetical protein